MSATKRPILAVLCLVLAISPIQSYSKKGEVVPRQSRYQIALAEKQGPAPNVTKYDALIQQEAAKYGMDWLMLKSLLAAESAVGLNGGKSTAGAYGIGQFMEPTAKEVKRLAGIDVYVSDENGIRAAAYYLNRQIQAKGGDIIRGMASYNWGGGAEGSRSGPGTGLDRLKAGHYPLETTKYPVRIARFYMKYGGQGSFRPIAEAILNGQSLDPSLGTLTSGDVQANCMADPSAFLTDSDGIGALDIPDALNHDEMAVNEMIDNEAHRRLVNDEWNANVTKVSSRALWVDYTHALATENYIERKNQEKRQNIEQLTSQLVALKVQNANRILTQDAHSNALNNKIINGAPPGVTANNSDPWWKFW